MEFCMEAQSSNIDSELSLVSEELARVEEVLCQEARSEAQLILSVSDHILKSGGKRFRPALLLLASRLCGYKGGENVFYAAAIEYAHTATLLHDDVVDEASVRRGKPSANIVFGNQASILVGDYLLFKAFTVIHQLGNYRILGLLNEIALQMAEGEAFQLERRDKIDVSEAEYFSTIIDKTASLISASCQIGAIIGEANRKQEEALADYGLNVGIAFQLVDDALDYANSKPKWGKQLGKDFMEGKATLPLIRAHKIAGEKERDWLKELFSRDMRRKEDYLAALEIILKSGGVDYTMEKARQYTLVAKKNLSIFSGSPFKNALDAMAEFVVNRTY
jgi:octaprenyl-diphosphate synthase